MGGSTYHDDHYTAKVAHKALHSIPTFDHHAAATRAVATGKASKLEVHENLNIKGKIREARDSAAHPESLPIAVLFDVTGSMGIVPTIVQQKIPGLMGLLLRKGYVEHPQICFAAVGDATCDEVPLQVGQFESGIEMDDDLTKFILEAGGGGQQSESYELGLYYFANRVQTDAWEKRGKKGYLFIVGDEKMYPRAERKYLEEIIGVTAESHASTEEIVAKLLERWEVFYILPNQTSYYNDAGILTHWKKYLGPERVLKLEDPNGVAELIATTIGLCEGNVGHDRIADDLASVGAHSGIVKAVTETTKGLKGTELATAGTATGLKPASKSPNTARI